MVVSLASVAASIRVTIWNSAKNTALTRGIAEDQCHSAPPGCTTIRTPARPTATAPQRCSPTRSPSITTDSAVMKSGAVKPITVTSAIGRWVRPRNRVDTDPASSAGRQICSARRLVANSTAGFFLRAA